MTGSPKRRSYVKAERSGRKRVSFDSELVRDDVLSWGAKNVIALKLSPQPSIEKENHFEPAQNKETKEESSQKEVEGHGEDLSKELLDYGTYHDGSKHFFEVDKKEAKVHFGHQNEVEAKDVHNPIFPEPIQDDLNMEIIADVLAKIRTVDSSLEQENSEKEEKKEEPSEKGREAEAIPDIENMQNLINSPIFDTFVKVAYGLGPILGESSSFSIPIPPLSTKYVNIEPLKVSEDILSIHIPLLQNMIRLSF
ncbi:hypothetical protein GYH30_009812 [Glycine max]|nr:hypothetical protein GYH30_009812 [Glycine max]